MSGASADPGRPLLPVATGAQTRAAIGTLLRQRWRLAVLAVLVLTTATVVGLITVPLLGRIVDLVAAGRPAASITNPVVILILIAIGQAVASGWGLTLVAQLGEGMLAELRERFITRALGLPLGQVEGAGTGDLTSRVTNDVTVIGTAVRSALPELARSVLAIVLTLAALAVLDWRFLLAALLAAPVQIHTVRWYSGRALPLYARQRVAVGAQQHQLLETVGGAATVRALRLQGRHVGLVTARSLAAVELTMRGVRLVTRFYARLNLAEYIGLSAVLVTGFLLVGNGSATIGTATAAALYFHNLFTPINTALGLVDDAQAATASLVRLVGVTQLPAPAEADRAVEAVVPADASVTVSAVQHAYRPGRPVLQRVNLEVAAGERVALVGASGAGKTTLAALIAGIRQPTGGTIRLGGVRLDDLDPGTVRRTVTLLTQEVHVFAGPLGDDLRLAQPGADDEDLVAALSRIGAGAWLAALPDGLATIIGDGGHRLTVTQAQQLALARLVLIDPPIAVLDEATAEAGSAGARLLEAAVEKALAGRTGIIVAHRLTQAVTADRVVVLDGGRVMESGPHEELLQRPGGPYAALWRAWADHRPA